MKKKMSIFFIVGLIFCLAPLTSYANYFQESGNVTAYSASQYKYGGALRTTASGLVPQNGFVAMQSATVNKTGIYGVPFGSRAVTPETITNYAGYNTDSYKVQDTGVSSQFTPYTIDIWWGYCRTYAYTGTGASPLNCNTGDAAYVSATKWGSPTMNLEFFTNR